MEICRVLEGTAFLRNVNWRQFRTIQELYRIVPREGQGLEWWKSLSCFHESDIFGSGQIIGVIDSGFDTQHPLLAEAVVNQIDLTGEGIDDGLGHGTVVSLLLLAAAPKARLVAIKTFKANGDCAGDSTEEREAKLAEAIALARKCGATVLNISAGFCREGKNHWSFSPNLYFCTCRICTAAGELSREGYTHVVAAGGNDTPPHNVGAFSICPASGAGVIPIIALEEGQPLFSPDHPSYCLGVSGIVPRFTNIDHSWLPKPLSKLLFRSRIKGSSFATPLVAGTIALLKELYSGWTPECNDSEKIFHRLFWGNPLYDHDHGEEEEEESHEEFFTFALENFFSSFTRGESDTHVGAMLASKYGVIQLADRYRKAGKLELALKAYMFAGRWLSRTEGLTVSGEHILRCFLQAAELLTRERHPSLEDVCKAMDLCREAASVAQRCVYSPALEEQWARIQEFMETWQPIYLHPSFRRRPETLGFRLGSDVSHAAGRLKEAFVTIRGPNGEIIRGSNGEIAIYEK
jgi:hypothetical protein